MRANRHDVTSSKNGEECIELYRTHLDKYLEQTKVQDGGLPGNAPFDVVILDYRMPKVNGMEAAKKILELNSNQRIIFASAYVYSTLQESVKELSRVVELMQKPFEIETLLNSVEDTQVYDGLKELNANIGALKEIQPTHDQIVELYKSLQLLQQGKAGI